MFIEDHEDFKPPSFKQNIGIMILIIFIVIMAFVYNYFN